MLQRPSALPSPSQFKIEEWNKICKVSISFISAPLLSEFEIEEFIHASAPPPPLLRKFKIEAWNEINVIILLLLFKSFVSVIVRCSIHLFESDSSPLLSNNL